MTDDAQLLEKVGTNIRRLRNEIGLSQEALAEKSKLHRTYIGAVERGERNLSLLSLASIAAALGAKPKDLMPDV